MDIKAHFSESQRWQTSRHGWNKRYESHIIWDIGPKKSTKAQKNIYLIIISAKQYHSWTFLMFCYLTKQFPNVSNFPTIMCMTSSHGCHRHRNSLEVKYPIGSHTKHDIISVMPCHAVVCLLVCSMSFKYTAAMTTPRIISLSHANSCKYLGDAEETLWPPRMQIHIPLPSFLSFLPMPYAKQTSSCWCRTFGGCDKHTQTLH